MHSFTRKKMTGVVLAFLIFVSAVFSVRPIVQASAADDYSTWSQMDPRWGDVSMNGTTVANSGCLITSLAVMAVHSNSIDDRALSNLGISSVSEFNPGVLADAYRNCGGFTYGGGIASWGTISQLIPQIDFIADYHLDGYTREEVASELVPMLINGYHIIINVNGHHWVYVERIEDDEIYMLTVTGAQLKKMIKYMLQQQPPQQLLQRPQQRPQLQRLRPQIPDSR